METPTPMTHPNFHHFASHGGMKMIYDARMGPQAIRFENKIFIVYHSGDNDFLFHPHIIAYDQSTNQWSPPVRLGTNEKPNHHLAPILWLDHGHRIHILFGCHFSPGTHLVSQNSLDITSWLPAPPIADSISYPTLFPLTDNRLCLLHRVEGHLGYWVYRTSTDGGWTWNQPRTILDFNDRPLDETDRWAGSYLAATPTLDRRGLHLGFCHWEERDNINPRYKFDIDLFSRYNLYYLKLNIDTGRLTTIDGQSLTPPVNRREADAARILDTAHEITNFPSIIPDHDDNPCLLTPISNDSPWHCHFHFLRRHNNQWQHTQFGQTDNVWSASHLQIDENDNLTAYVIEGHDKSEEIFYGGGNLNKYTSTDHGQTWSLHSTLDPIENHLYNNPRPILDWPTGKPLQQLYFYGWQNTGQTLHPSKPMPNIGKGLIQLPSNTP